MPNFIIIAGSNGSGKTTAAMALMPTFGVRHFLNADEIARGLSPLNPSIMDLQAGKLLLTRMNDLFEAGESFAVETTLSGHTYVRAIHKAKALGYKVILIYIYVDNVETSIARVSARVEQGGHNIPIETIKRRYEASLKNLINIYSNIVDVTNVYYNSNGNLEGIASKSKDDFFGVWKIKDAQVGNFFSKMIRIELS